MYINSIQILLYNELNINMCIAQACLVVIYKNCFIHFNIHSILIIMPQVLPFGNVKQNYNF